jgi:hypothetical protein
MKIDISQADKSDAAHVNMALLAYWTLRLRLMRVPGVANVAIWGDRWSVKTIQVDPDWRIAVSRGARRRLRRAHPAHQPGRQRWGTAPSSAGRGPHR